MSNRCCAHCADDNVEFLPSTIKSIKKRDNSEVGFNIERIVTAIKNAGIETGEFGEETARDLAQDVEKVLRFKFDGKAPEIEEIQDVVEYTLARSGYFKTAKAYILYRENR